MYIKLDTREHDLIARCNHYKEISPIYKDLEFVVESLPIGDIILSKNNEDLLIIERKSLSDLASSIKDGRYEEQSYRLNGSSIHNHNIIYLVEGDMQRLNQFKDRTDKTTLYSAMLSLNYYKGFSVLRSMNLDESALMICNIAYKINKMGNKPPFYSNINMETTPQELQESQEYCNVVKKVKKENITEENIGEIMLCQIPGISSVSAIAIMKEFKTINNLILRLNEDKDCVKHISYTNSKGQIRKISKNVIENIVLFLSKKE
jgi:crossover junction endonuclease MUS81